MATATVKKNEKRLPTGLKVRRKRRPRERKGSRSAPTAEAQREERIQTSTGVGPRGDGYEAAKTTRVNEGLWRDASAGEADIWLLHSLGTIRNRARYEMRNSGYASGIVETYVNDIVGAFGPRLQINSDDEKLNEDAEKVWAAWMPAADFRGRLHFVDILRQNVGQLWPAGEWFNQMVNAGGRDMTAFREKIPVSLRLMPIEPDRIQNPGGTFSDEFNREGITVDDDGRVISYFVLDEHPDGLALTTSDEGTDVPAADMLHVFDEKRPGQSRGEPILAPVLNLFGHLRSFTEDTLLAARVAAMLAGFIFTDHPNIDLDDEDDELPIFDLETMTISTLPKGWKVDQITPKHPGATFKEFKREMLSEVGRPVGMPFLRVGADASGHNFSSARLDLQIYWSGIRTKQGWIERSYLNPLLIRILSEWALLTGRASAMNTPLRINWTWPPVPQVDPLKEALAAKVRLLLGTTNLARETENQGTDWNDILVQRAKEQEKAKELGIDDIIEPLAKGTAARASADETIITDMLKESEEEEQATSATPPPPAPVPVEEPV